MTLLPIRPVEIPNPARPPGQLGPAESERSTFGELLERLRSARPGGEPLPEEAQRGLKLLAGLGSGTPPSDPSLRGALTAALESRGYHVRSTPLEDRIVVGTQVVDLALVSSRELLEQLIQDGPEEAVSEVPTGDSSPPTRPPESVTGTIPAGLSASEALLTAGAPYGEYFDRITASTSRDERRAIGSELQSLVVESLRASGYDASAGSGPDRIVVNGTAFDFIARMNVIGETARLQAYRG